MSPKQRLGVILCLLRFLLLHHQGFIKFDQGISEKSSGQKYVEEE
jgi:hypothetical protein